MTTHSIAPNDSEAERNLSDLLRDSGILLHEADEMNPYACLSLIRIASTDESHRNRTCVYSEELSRVDPNTVKACIDQLQFLRTFRKSWAATEPHTLGIPEKWKVCNVTSLFRG